MLSQLVSAFFPPDAPRPEPKMNDEDKAVIVSFAHGDDALISEAIEAHRRSLRFGEDYPEALKNFMNEYDTLMPDIGYRRVLREMVLREFPATSPAPGSR